jgi:hypothetical protein
VGLARECAAARAVRAVEAVGVLWGTASCGVDGLQLQCGARHCAQLWEGCAGCAVRKLRAAGVTPERIQIAQCVVATYFALAGDAR